MVACQLIALVFVMVLAWFMMRLLFHNAPELRVMGLFGCTHKTVAMGVPLINAIYDTNPNVGLYTLPLLIWHSLQLLLGSLPVPRLHKWVLAENERLSIKEDRSNTAAVKNSHDSEEHGASLFAAVDDEQPSIGPPVSN
jgi:sodium/bile acid cotransporter 7